MLTEGNLRNRLCGLGTVSDLLIRHLDLRATVHTTYCFLGKKPSPSPECAIPGHSPMQYAFQVPSQSASHHMTGVSLPGNELPPDAAAVAIFIQSSPSSDEDKTLGEPHSVQCYSIDTAAPCIHSLCKDAIVNMNITTIQVHQDHFASSEGRAS
jgi:hypothetical protein